MPGPSADQVPGTHPGVHPGTPPGVADLAASATGPTRDFSSVLRIRAFRQLWTALSLSSLGDWLGLLAQTALAAQLTHRSSESVTAFAISGVLVVRLLPDLVLGPIAGAVADRLDRRRTMVVCNGAQFLLFVSIPLVHSLAYLLGASFLVECFGRFWSPAKEASVPNLVPAERLEAANTLSLITTYGTAPVAALIFAALSLLSRVLASFISFFHASPVDLALYFDALTFAVSGFTIFQLKMIKRVSPRRERASGAPEGPGSVPAPAAGLVGFGRSILDGWRFVGQTPLVRGLVVGMLGAFAAGGCVIALGRLYVVDLHAGNAAYGLLFGGLFVGLAAGMALGTRLIPGFSRKRLFGLSIAAAGGTLVVVSVLPNLLLALLGVVGVGAFAGVGWVTGYTLLGVEVADAVRGRTFALVQSLVRVDLLATLAIAPLVVGLIGRHAIRLPNGATIRADGVTIVLFVAGVIALAVGVAAFRVMDDRAGVGVWRDLLTHLRHRTSPVRHPGFFVAVEGGEGAGKSTAVAGVAAWLASRGAEVVVTREPGASRVGVTLRALLLDPAGAGLSPRTEALLYAADRAQHVEEVVLPALRRGAVVVSDRYVDSSLAYQGAGRDLPLAEVERLSAWASGGLRPDLTILLDVDPAVGLTRVGSAPDRMEAQGRLFHERVRQGFLELAEREPGRYAVISGEAPPERVVAEAVVALRRFLRARPEPELARLGAPVDPDPPAPVDPDPPAPVDPDVGPAQPSWASGHSTPAAGS